MNTLTDTSLHTQPNTMVLDYEVPLDFDSKVTPLQPTQQDTDNNEPSTTRLQPIERTVYNPKHNIEHALGAKLAHNLEHQAILDEETFLHGKVLEKARQTYAKRSKVKDLAEAVLRVTFADQKAVQNAQEATIESRRASINNNYEADVLLEDARAKLNKRYEQKGPLTGIVEPYDLPPFLFAAYTRDADKRQQSGQKPQQITSWLTERSAIGSERLANFLKYNTHVNELLQDNPIFKEAVRVQIAEWSNCVEAGIEGGWLHRHAFNAVDYKGDLEVILGDYFDLDARDYGGYSLAGEEYVSLPQFMQGIEHAAKHEFNHALLGWFGEKWLNEAVTEHIAQVFNGIRGIEDVMSYGVQDGRVLTNIEDSNYRNHRNIIGTLIKLCGGKLKMRDFTYAYSQRDPTSMYEPKPYERLSKKVDAALGTKDALPKISKFITAQQDQYMQERKIDYWEALKKACFDVNSALRQEPHRIFGPKYKPKKHINTLSTRHRQAKNHKS